MKSSVKTTTIIVSTVLGALLGYQVAQILIKQSEEAGKSSPISTAQGLQVGLSALTMLRQISSGK